MSTGIIAHCTVLPDCWAFISVSLNVCLLFEIKSPNLEHTAVDKLGNK